MKVFRLIWKWNSLKENGRVFIGLLIALVIMVVLSLVINQFTSLGIGQSIRVVFGGFYMLFLPGFVLSYVFFPKTRRFDASESGKEKNKQEIDWIERIALSFALSIAVVPLGIFYLNLLGIRITPINSFLTVLGIILVGLGLLWWKTRRRLV